VIANEQRDQADHWQEGKKDRQFFFARGSPQGYGVDLTTTGGCLQEKRQTKRRTVQVWEDRKEEHQQRKEQKEDLRMAKHAVQKQH
jgi:hypothetical protein